MRTSSGPPLVLNLHGDAPSRRAPEAQAGVILQVFHRFWRSAPRKVVGARDHDQPERRGQALGDHVLGDELSQAHPGVEALRGDVDEFVADGDLQFDLRIGGGEGRENRLSFGALFDPPIGFQH